jgi:NitT/TauT family transport system substrate-binding protein
VPLGGGGLVPNLLTGNVDATVLYSPLTYQVMQAKQARSIADFGELVPPHSTGLLDRAREDHQPSGRRWCRRR